MKRANSSSSGFLRPKKPQNDQDGARNKGQRLQQLAGEGGGPKGRRGQGQGQAQNKGDGGDGGAGDEQSTKKPFDKRKWRENKYSNKVKSKLLEAEVFLSN